MALDSELQGDRTASSRRDEHGRSPKLRILLVALYSERYPAVGETHGLTVVAGAIAHAFGADLDVLRVLDLVAVGREDIAPIVEALADVRPDVLGIAVPYGTFDVLVRLRPEIQRLLNEGRCVLVGGALPSYIGHLMLRQIDERLAIVVGEGERASVQVVEAWRNRSPFDNIPNLQWSEDGLVKAGPRRLADSTNVPAPYREHLADVVRSGAQVFVEASRACSWAACSFCLRGLTDIEGKPREYRRLAITRLVEDLKKLVAMGVSAVTFADEDFLGGSIDEVTAFVQELESSLRSESLKMPSFDVSATIHSISKSPDDYRSREQKIRNLAALHDIGLRKVFLGIESGSPSQLRRYRKGHTVDECIDAANAVIRTGIQLELGFIMFDPLCTLSEVVENVRFLLDNNLAQYVSGPTSELRLQSGSRYLAILDREEARQGRLLYDRSLDPNTLSYSSTYAHPQVERLIETVRHENEESHDVVYRLKGLTRFGDGAILGKRTQEVRDLLGAYRIATLNALGTSALTDVNAYASLARSELDSLAKSFIRVVELDAPQSPIVVRAIDAARRHLKADIKQLNQKEQHSI